MKWSSGVAPPTLCQIHLWSLTLISIVIIFKVQFPTSFGDMMNSIGWLKEQIQQRKPSFDVWFKINQINKWSLTIYSKIYSQIITPISTFAFFSHVSSRLGKLVKGYPKTRRVIVFLLLFFHRPEDPWDPFKGPCSNIQCAAPIIGAIDSHRIYVWFNDLFMI